MFAIALNSCSDSLKKRYKDEYYASGKLKTRGWYINDTIPIDTIFTFYESGKILAKEVYDSIGSAVKSISYFENGIVHKDINYKNGLANGFFYVFRESGNLESMGFFVNDKQIGDTYYYSSTGNHIRAYSFFDWEERPINLLKYDSLTGTILKDMRQVIFIDTVEYSKGNLNNSNQGFLSCNVQIVISNPPKCRSTVKVDYLSTNGILMKSDSVVNKPYYFKKENIADSLFTIKISAIQYDSIKKKTVFQDVNKQLD